MKSMMIDDYFGHSPKVKISSDAFSLTICKPQKKSSVVDHTVQNHDGAVMQEVNKEARKKAVSTDKNYTLFKEKSKEPLEANLSVGKKGKKIRSLSKKKQLTEEDGNVDVTDVNPCVSNFALKIRLKSKDKNNDELIEEFSSPEQAKPQDDKANGIKSPQSTMFKYLIHQKSTSPTENIISKPKVSKDISDFFGPANAMECRVSRTACNAQAGSATVVSVKVQGEEEITRTGKRNRKSPQTAVKISTKKVKAKKLSICNNKEVEKSSTSPASESSILNLKCQTHTGKITPARKSKSSTKSLTLSKTDECARPRAPPKGELDCVKTDTGSQKSVAKSIDDAFKKIVLKSSLDSLFSLETEVPSKKRKREGYNNNGAPNSISSLGDSPVKSKRRLGRTNQINSDSDNESSAKLNLNAAKSSANEKCADISCNSEVPLKGEESNKNSLMKYFSKVSKEEILAKSEKIELKVKALVHSPPTTPSKKAKRRSINSLPGGTISLPTKRGNGKKKENENAIEALVVEENKGKDIERVAGTQIKQLNTARTGNILSSPCQDLAPGKIDDLPTLKHNECSKPAKRVSLRGKYKNPPVKTTKIEDESVPSSLTVSEYETKPDSSSLQSSWKLRVCLNSLPSSQGTLLEEDSDNEIFLTKKEKKRRLDIESKSEDISKEDFADLNVSPDIIFEKKTNMKMAPLFTRKADSHARQLFLLSGVPDKVKRVLETQASFEEQEAEIFPKESHIQQKDANEWMWNLSAVNLPLKHDCYEEICDDLGSFSLNDVSGCCNMKEQVERIVAISCKGPEMRPVFGLPMDVIKPILRMIKQESPDFKVVNTFKALRTKYREEEFLKAAALSTLAENQRPKRKSSNRKSFDSQSVNSSVSYRARVWTEKYKPSCSTDVIGNSECVSQLKRWLEAWRKASEDATKLGKEDLKQKKKKTDLIDDDFVVSDNSSDSVRNNQPVGVAVLYGPHGCGKTSTVYALANDLGYKVLEVNASEKRNGKLVLSKLSEATQSHQVQQSNTAKQDFAKLFGKSSASKNRKQKHLGPKRVNLEEEKSKKMSLILFEDVDVVFEEEDEGFLSAVNSLLSTSKRPVILTTTDPDSTLISRFMNNSSLILQFSCPSKLLYTWLQIVSILEGVYAAPDTVRDLVFLCKGDFRRALLQMQLWVMSGGNNLAVPSISHSSHNSRKGFQGCDDDNLSDFDDECENIVPSILANPDCVGMLLGKNYDIDGVCASELQVKRAFVKVPYPLNLGLFWWNIPPLLSLRQIKHTQLPVIKEDTATTVTKAMLDDSFMASFCTDDGSTSNTSEDVGLTYSQETSVAISYEPQEVEKHHGVHNAVVKVNPVSRNSCKEEEMNAMAYQMISMSFIDVISFSSCLPGVSSTEPVSRFSQTLLKDSLALVKEDIEGPNFLFHSISEDVSHWLAEQTINNSRALLCDDNLDAQSFYNNCLPNEEEHRWRSLYAKTEHNILSILPPFMLLEHRSIATDYLPVLRTMCRLEKNRNTINTKRRNRFYHYLKSLGANLSAAELELLCRTMIDY